LAQSLDDLSYIQKNGVGAFFSRQKDGVSQAVNGYMEGVGDLLYYVTGGRNSWSFQDVGQVASTGGKLSFDIGTAVIGPETLLLKNGSAAAKVDAAIVGDIVRAVDDVPISTGAGKTTTGESARRSQVDGSLNSQLDQVGGSSGLPSGMSGALPEVDLFAAARGKDLSKLTHKEVGDLGEDISRLFLAENKFTDVFSIQNKSGNGIDIVGRSPDGSLVFIEVKTSRTDSVGNLSGRQQSMDSFVEDVLTQAASATGRYKNISLIDQMRADDMLREFLTKQEAVRGNVIGIDLGGEMLRISPWSRN